MRINRLHEGLAQLFMGGVRLLPPGLIVLDIVWPRNALTVIPRRAVPDAAESDHLTHLMIQHVEQMDAEVLP